VILKKERRKTMTYNKPKVVVLKAASAIQSAGAHLKPRGPYIDTVAPPPLYFSITAYEADE
jgi:hypothetical protein